MNDNQTCYVCERPCRPGRGITDNGGRRHITCPVSSPAQLAQRQLALAKARSRRQSAATLEGTAIAEVRVND